jgi:uncharacterized protein (TIGR02246 family)
MITSLAALLLATAPSIEDAVRSADLALDAAAAARDPQSFAALLEEDAVFAGRRVSRGRAAVVESWRPFLAEGGPRLRWAPLRAGVAASGDLAFTVGRWTLERTGEEGKAERAEGEYVTVWRRGADGAWRALLDAAHEPAAKLGAGLARTPVRTAASAAGDLEATLGTWTRSGGEGAYLVVRRRLPGGGWEAAVDSAFPFPPPPPGRPQ